jgi:hypothetical protein
LTNEENMRAERLQVRLDEVTGGVRITFGARISTGRFALLVCLAAFAVALGTTLLAVTVHVLREPLRESRSSRTWLLVAGVFYLGFSLARFLRRLGSAIANQFSVGASLSISETCLIWTSPWSARLRHVYLREKLSNVRVETEEYRFAGKHIVVRRLAFDHAGRRVRLDNFLSGADVEFLLAGPLHELLASAT